MKKFFYVATILCLLINFTAYSKEYRQIVSLAPSVTKSLYELGCEQFIKGITTYCPKGTTEKYIIGTFLDPDVEKIILLDPDLIIVTKDGNNKTVTEKLVQLGFEVHTVEAAENFNDICINYHTLANKLNKIKIAKEQIEIAKCSLKTIYKKLNKFDKSKLFWEIGTHPLYTVGNKSFINDYNYYTKTINVYEDVNMRYFAVSIDDIVERNPDIMVFVNIRPNTSEIKNWNKYKNVEAVKNNKIFMLDSDDIFSSTPLTFVESVKMLTKIIYGDVV
ncbi:MAG: helical backbone metal receptor [Endomicrobium sp.]|jgi:iron complex transport system substrate-binding protein|nr:helical backbone metal receptor [Endomicrobium sp.]